MRYLIIIISFLTLILVSFSGPTELSKFNYPEQLSEYGYFTGDLKDLVPAEDVIPYELNTPLFTDYALKARFMKIPEGTKITYEEIKVFQFPVGSVLIKNFYYPADYRKADQKVRIMETRLLIHEEDGWVALPYIWNDDQTDAILEVAGGTAEIQWKNEKGKKMITNYSIPNMNQCKGCHNRDGKIFPIGPTARQLNRDYEYADGPMNQLEYLVSKELIELPEGNGIPRSAVWNKPSTGSLDERARIYLDINCAHCHSAEGPANTTGLFLNIYQNDDIAYGIMKTPVAAGRGSGGLSYDIVPGKPNESILVYRMESTHPGIAMPEIGRTLVHQEGVALVREWIKKLESE